MHVEVIVGFVVDVVIQGREVRRSPGGNEDRVGGEDLEGFSIDVLFFRLPGDEFCQRSIDWR